MTAPINTQEGRGKSHGAQAPSLDGEPQAVDGCYEGEDCCSPGMSPGLVRFLAVSTEGVSTCGMSRGFI